jgi:hypothetical protein
MLSEQLLGILRTYWKQILALQPMPADARTDTPGPD